MQEMVLDMAEITKAHILKSTVYRTVENAANALSTDVRMAGVLNILWH